MEAIIHNAGVYTQRTRLDSIRASLSILLVAQLLEPIHFLAADGFVDGDVGHCCRGVLQSERMRTPPGRTSSRCRALALQPAKPLS